MSTIIVENRYCRIRRLRNSIKELEKFKAHLSYLVFIGVITPEMLNSKYADIERQICIYKDEILEENKNYSYVI